MSELLCLSSSLLTCLIFIIFNIIPLQMLGHPATTVQIATAPKSPKARDVSALASLPPPAVHVYL